MPLSFPSGQVAPTRSPGHTAGAFSYLEVPLPAQLPSGLLLVAACVVVLMLTLIAVIVLAVLRRARPEDLPQVLHGLGSVISALTCFLPWGRKQGADPAPVAESSAEASALQIPNIAVTTLVGEQAKPTQNGQDTGVGGVRQIVRGENQ